MSHYDEEREKFNSDKTNAFIPEKLRDCPFCGGKMWLDYDTRTGMFGPEGDHKKGCFIGSTDFRDFSSEFEAINMWNKTPKDFD